MCTPYPIGKYVRGEDRRRWCEAELNARTFPREGSWYESHYKSPKWPTFLDITIRQQASLQAIELIAGVAAKFRATGGPRRRKDNFLSALARWPTFVDITIPRLWSRTRFSTNSLIWRRILPRARVRSRRLRSSVLRMICGSCSHCALISLNFANARSNTPLKSHIASRISRMVADVLEWSTCPNVKILLLRKYRITLGSDTLCGALGRGSVGAWVSRGGTVPRPLDRVTPPSAQSSAC
jgi:hypothetical protein